MGCIQQPTISQALDGLWFKFLPEIRSRVATLEVSSAALAAGSLSTHQRSLANEAAHKLAGVLGTFGLTHGTVLAREAENIYSNEPAIDSDAAERLGQIAEQLSSIVATRK
jgi:HPt (histidine-containing phosphotransfer) domain-containing protein